MVPEVLSLVGTTTLVVIGWVFTLGTRVSVIESRQDDLITLINSKLDEVNRRLGRIEDLMYDKED